jgi:hypothetical protein
VFLSVLMSVLMLYKTLGPLVLTIDERKAAEEWSLAERKPKPALPIGSDV